MRSDCVLTATKVMMYYYCPHFTDGKAEAHREAAGRLLETGRVGTRVLIHLSLTPVFLCTPRTLLPSGAESWALAGFKNQGDIARH